VKAMVQVKVIGQMLVKAMDNKQVLWKFCRETETRLQQLEVYIYSNIIRNGKQVCFQWGYNWVSKVVNKPAQSPLMTMLP
jgi:hypothetical protein